MQLDYYTEITNLLENNSILAISTVTPDGKPWLTPVAAAYDKELNFFWYSHRDTQHSKNIREDSSAFAVLFNQSGTGLYIKGVACELQETNTLIHAKETYTQKFSAEKIGEFMPPANRRFYQLSPKAIWTNDAEKLGKEFLRDFRVALDLGRIKENIHETP